MSRGFLKFKKLLIGLIVIVLWRYILSTAGNSIIAIFLVK